MPAISTEKKPSVTVAKNVLSRESLSGAKRGGKQYSVKVVAGKKRHSMKKAEGKKVTAIATFQGTPVEAMVPISAITYYSSRGIEDFVSRVATASPEALIATERLGVNGVFLKDLSKKMDLPSSRVFAMLGVPKATAEKKAATRTLVTGSGGYASLGIARLLGIVNSMLTESTAEGAKSFNSGKWLGTWLERPQPALGGKKPAEFIDTPTGIEMVSRLLGSISSGAYQ